MSELKNAALLRGKPPTPEQFELIVSDTDVLIRNDMDELFEREAPAAVRRHPQGKYLDYADIDGCHLFDGKRN